MVNKKKLLESPMGKALVELSEKMNERGINAVEINVIGGFALMLRGARDINGITDIDYVGDTLNDDFNTLAEEIGFKHNLGHGWINKDVMLSDISMEDFEYATGKLNFDKAAQIGNITINVLQEEDLLRMKLISIDTSLTGMEFGGDFTRAKDLNDIVELLKAQKLTTDDIQAKFGEYLINPVTPAIVKIYQVKGEKGVNTFMKKVIDCKREAAIAYRNKKRALLRDELDEIDY